MAVRGQLSSAMRQYHLAGDAFRLFSILLSILREMFCCLTGRLNVSRGERGMLPLLFMREWACGEKQARGRSGGFTPHHKR